MKTDSILHIVSPLNFRKIYDDDYNNDNDETMMLLMKMLMTMMMTTTMMTIMMMIMKLSGKNDMERIYCNYFLFIIETIFFTSFIRQLCEFRSRCIMFLECKYACIRKTINYCKQQLEFCLHSKYNNIKYSEIIQYSKNTNNVMK